MNYAVMSGNNVTNVIVADSKEIAEQVTGFTCIEYTDENPAMIGGTHDGDTFIDAKPYPSWVLNSNKKWEAPVARPETGNYSWNEETLSWVEFDINQEEI